MNDTPLFDDDNEPTTPFDRGMAGSEQSASKWTADEVTMVDLAIRACSRAYNEFTADDVWARLPEGFRVTKGLASRLKVAKNDGWIRSSGTTRTSKRDDEHGHGQRHTVWVSVLRCGPEPQPQPSPDAQRLGNIREDLEIAREMLANDRADNAIILIDKMLDGYF